MKRCEYQDRRRGLMAQLGKGAIAIVPTASVALRNGDVEHPFRPDSDFYYLTGFAEPEAVAVFIGGKRPKFVLFCRERNPRMERWDGRRAGLKGARKRYRADASFDINELECRLPGLLEGRKRLYYPLGSHARLDRLLPRWLRQLQRRARSGLVAPEGITNLDQTLHGMRLIKSASEIERMRQAAAISAEAHNRLMRTCKGYTHEYQLEAEFVHHCQLQGSRRQAYPPIVASGDNACILHYVENDHALRAGELLLVDAGAEYRGYAADITRTFPLSGHFSPAQRSLYALVLQAQLAAIDAVRPGRRWNDPHEAAVRVLTRGLVDLGLLKGSVSRQLKRGGYKRFYMHRTGHWLGMDVHDVGDYKRSGKWRRLRPGMVLTVEPGLYIDADDKKVDRRWRGIGIRIEDDVLVTRKGHEVLSAAAVKSVAGIEEMMG
jgi:Xaa-Pro aminopeptidase